MSEDGDMLCPDCLASMSRREIDSEAMEMAAETLGFRARERLGGASHDLHHS